MKKLLYIGIIVLSVLVPVKRLDIAKLLPVEAVAIYYNGDSIVLKTDTGNIGFGENAIQALADLKEKTTGVIYLDTAKYLLVGADADSAAAQLRRYLKPNLVLGEYMGGDVGEEAKYLDAHHNAAKPA